VKRRDGERQALRKLRGFQAINQTFYPVRPHVSIALTTGTAPVLASVKSCSQVRQRTTPSRICPHEISLAIDAGEHVAILAPTDPENQP
jgi:hypothetical protein